LIFFFIRELFIVWEASPLSSLLLLKQKIPENRTGYIPGVLATELNPTPSTMFVHTLHLLLCLSVAIFNGSKKMKEFSVQKIGKFDKERVQSHIRVKLLLVYCMRKPLLSFVLKIFLPFLTVYLHIPAPSRATSSPSSSRPTAENTASLSRRVPPVLWLRPRPASHFPPRLPVRRTEILLLTSLKPLLASPTMKS
jgi:hypothetical protein